MSHLSNDTIMNVIDDWRNKHKVLVGFVCGYLLMCCKVFMHQPNSRHLILGAQSDQMAKLELGG